MATEINFVNDDVVAKSLESLEGADAVDVNATGDVTANAFIGDGSQLTNLPAQGVVTEAVKAFLTADATFNNGTTFSARNVFPATGSLSVNSGGFTSATAGITVPSTGIYIVSATFVYQSTATRTNPEVRFTINSTGQLESTRSAYIRSSSGHNESSSGLTTVYNMVAGDTLGLESRQIGGAGTVNLETNSVVIMYRIG